MQQVRHVAVAHAHEPIAKGPIHLGDLGGHLSNTSRSATGNGDGNRMWQLPQWINTVILVAIEQPLAAVDNLG